MNIFSTIALSCALTLIPGTSSPPEAPAAQAEASIEGLRLGEYWYGKQITKKDLAGKVVLVEIWGS